MPPSMCSVLAGCHDNGHLISLTRAVVNNPNPSMKFANVWCGVVREGRCRKKRSFSRTTPLGAVDGPTPILTKSAGVVGANRGCSPLILRECGVCRMFSGCSQAAWVHSQRMWVGAPLYSQIIWAGKCAVIGQSGLCSRVITCRSHPYRYRRERFLYLCSRCL
jgi:hypothetical protein